MKDRFYCKDDFIVRLGRFLLGSVISVILSFSLVGCISCGSKPDERLRGVFEDEELEQKKGYDCILKLDMSFRSRYVNDAILNGNGCNGRIALYKVVSDVEEQVGSDFYITNLEAANKTTLTFHLVYAGVKGKRVEVPGCRLVRQKGNTAYISLGEEWPFASEYRVNVIEDQIFSPDDLVETWYGFSLEKPYAADHYMFNIYSKYAWVFVAIFLLAVVFFIWHGAYKNLGMLCVMGAICFVSVTHHWTLAFPIVIPFFVALILMFIPYLNTSALAVFGIGSGLSMLYAIVGLWHDYGFFLFLWKALYIGVCSLWAGMAGLVVFTGRCGKCGSFILENCHRRKEYFAAKDVLSIPLNSNGLMAEDPMPLINSYEEKTEGETCYWCAKD